MVATFVSEAIEILKESKKPLNVKDIAKRMIERENIKTSGATPEWTLSARINGDIRAKGNKSAFIKITAGIFSFNKNYKEEVKIKPEPIIKYKEEPQEEIVTFSI